MRLFLILLFSIQNIGLIAQQSSISADSIRLQGVEHQKKDDFEKAKTYYFDAITKYLKIGDSIGVAKCYNNLGYLYQEMGSPTKALEFFHKAIEINKLQKNDNLLSSNYINVGTLFYRQDNLEKALEYYLLAKSIPTLPVHKSAFVDVGIGNIYSKKDFTGYNLETAQSYQLSALSSFLKAKDSSNIALSYNNIGVIYEKLDKPDQAVDYYFKSLYIKQLQGNSKGVLIAFLNLGNMAKLKGDYTLSHQYYIQAKQLATKQSDAFNYLHILSNLVSVNMEMGNANAASSLFDEYRILRDSLYSEEKAKQLVELQTQYETALKDSEIELYKTEQAIKTRQNRLLLGLTLIISALSITSILFFIQKQRTMKILRKKEDELHFQELNKLQKDQVLKSLSAMMLGQEQERERIAADLHDRIGSKLSAIRLFSESDNDQGQITTLLDQAIQETREISHNLASGILSKFGLIAALEDLFNTINSSKKIKIYFNTTNITSRLEANIENSLYYIIQELINNTLRHAKATNIYVQFTLDTAGELTLMYEDDGIGFDSLAADNSGLGLSNLKVRASRINANITIDSSIGNGQTTIVTLKI